ncbi:hypothetical protein [Halocatena halophila]|uniref:hypothetical protein n=1 Tax=Halocatena halophila TaxID=2814576 RepID=UPI002ED460C6
MVTKEQIERHWITVLAEFWLQTDWDKFSGQKKSRADTFGERVEVATRAGGVHEALDKLAKGLGQAVPKLPTADLDPLVTDEDQSMRILRREEVWIVNKTDETVQNYFEDKKDSDPDPEPTTSKLTDFITED